MGGIARIRAILENVVPPGVAVGGDAHVVRHRVENLAQPVRLERGDEGGVVVLGADLRVQRAVIDDVIPVRAAGPGLEIRRSVTVRDAQCAQVGHDPGRVGKGKAGMKLQPIRGFGQAPPAGDDRPGLLQNRVDQLDGLAPIYGPLMRGG